MPYQVETTDTFGGESNYSWVRRYLIDSPKAPYGTPAYRRELTRAAKAATGWTGLRCDTDHGCGMVTIRPRGICQVTFVTSFDGDYFAGQDLRTVKHPAAFWAEHIGLGYHPDNSPEDYLDRDGYFLSGAMRDRYTAEHADADDTWPDVAMAEWRRLGLIGPTDGL